MKSLFIVNSSSDTDKSNRHPGPRCNYQNSVLHWPRHLNKPLSFTSHLPFITKKKLASLTIQKFKVIQSQTLKLYSPSGFGGFIRCDLDSVISKSIGVFLTRKFFKYTHYCIPQSQKIIILLLPDFCFLTLWRSLLTFFLKFHFTSSDLSTWKI